MKFTIPKQQKGDTLSRGVFQQNSWNLCVDCIENAYEKKLFDGKYQAN